MSVLMGAPSAGSSTPTTPVYYLGAGDGGTVVNAMQNATDR
jgi:hypothetical protein